MQQDQDENFQRLARIAKFMVPIFILIIGSALAWFEFSNQVLNINVVNKNVEWSEGCSQGRCSGIATFYIVTDAETFITTKAIYSQMVTGRDYDVETEGFKGFAVHRRIDYLF
ncbi:hypothetical protein [Shewanella surugensis]|uniref:Uncharacterized protein n=1 Tax=Shewanella surugensis TaxID=212020 RepID=A0ABT0LJL1_9GAMM|nr:hypothetical protein [Shewanella surugensis]MCL1127482.1 hypothetical protein [Shewanella surugensis]